MLLAAALRAGTAPAEQTVWDFGHGVFGYDRNEKRVMQVSGGSLHQYGPYESPHGTSSNPLIGLGRIKFESFIKS